VAPFSSLQERVRGTSVEAKPLLMVGSAGMVTGLLAVVVRVITELEVTWTVWFQVDGVAALAEARPMAPIRVVAATPEITIFFILLLFALLLGFCLCTLSIISNHKRFVKCYLEILNTALASLLPSNETAGALHLPLGLRPIHPRIVLEECEASGNCQGREIRMARKPM